jgi:hypothetical protein
MLWQQVLQAVDLLDSTRSGGARVAQALRTAGLTELYLEAGAR